MISQSSVDSSKIKMARIEAFLTLNAIEVCDIYISVAAHMRTLSIHAYCESLFLIKKKHMTTLFLLSTMHIYTFIPLHSTNSSHVDLQLVIPTFSSLEL